MPELAYAGRIDERLQQVAATAASKVADDRLLPTLADRATAVHDTVTEVVGPLEHSQMSITKAAGWHAGRAASDTPRHRPRPPCTADMDRAARAHPEPVPDLAELR